MTDETLDLTDIEARDATFDDYLSISDRRVLLAEVKRLRAQVADAWDEGYRNGYSIGYRDDPTALTNYENPYRTQPEETP